MILEGVGAANVADDGSGVAVPALIHDADEIGAAFSRYRDEASAWLRLTVWVYPGEMLA